MAHSLALSQALRFDLRSKNMYSLSAYSRTLLVLIKHRKPIITENPCRLSKISKKEQFLLVWSHSQKAGGSQPSHHLHPCLQLMDGQQQERAKPCPHLSVPWDQSFTISPRGADASTHKHAQNTFPNSSSGLCSWHLRAQSHMLRCFYLMKEE